MLYQIVITDATLKGRGGTEVLFVFLEHDEWHELVARIMHMKKHPNDAAECLFQIPHDLILDVRCIISVALLDDLAEGDDDGGPELDPRDPPMDAEGNLDVMRLAFDIGWGGEGEG